MLNFPLSVTRDGFIDKEDLHDMLASLGKDPSDEYLEDSLPDLVLSSYCYQNTEDFLASLDLPDLAHELTEIAEEETDIDAEYFSSGDQVTAVGQSVSYVDHSKVPPVRVGGHDVWKSYLNLAPHYEDVERDGDIEEQFKRLVM